MEGSVVLETSAENWSAPAAPDTQMDEMRGEHRRSWGLAARASEVQESQIAASGPGRRFWHLFGSPGKSQVTRLKLLCALKIKRWPSYARSVSSGATSLKFPEYTNAQIHHQQGN